MVTNGTDFGPENKIPVGMVPDLSDVISLTKIKVYCSVGYFSDSSSSTESDSYSHDHGKTSFARVQYIMYTLIISPAWPDSLLFPLSFEMALLPPHHINGKRSGHARGQINCLSPLLRGQNMYQGLCMPKCISLREIGSG